MLGIMLRQAARPNPTDRRRLGSKHHIVTDGHGIPLAALVTGAHRHDVTPLLPLLEAIPAGRGKPGRPRCRPKRVYGDRGYDSEPHRQQLRAKGITPVLAKRGTAHGSGLGVYRWVVERTLAWLPHTVGCGCAMNAVQISMKHSWLLGAH